MNASECMTLQELMEQWKKKPPLHTSYRIYDMDVPLTIDHQKRFFIEDGIVDEQVWSGLPWEKRILYIFKEAYERDWTKAQWSLSQELNANKPWGVIWNRVCEWTYGIQNTYSHNIAKYEPQLIQGQNTQLIHKISVMNLKKSGGESTSVSEEIAVYAQTDKEEIIREIELIDPYIVVCGYTLGILDNLLSFPIKAERNDNWFYYSDAIGGKTRLFIDFYHPSNHFPSLLNYYGLIGIYQQALLNSEK